MTITGESIIQAELDGAAQAGEVVHLYLRKGLGSPRDVGELARLAARSACRAMYWQSEQARRDSIEHTVLTQKRPYIRKGEPVFFGKTQQEIEWETFDRDFFNRKQWEWFNAVAQPPATP